MDKYLNTFRETISLRDLTDIHLRITALTSAGSSEPEGQGMTHSFPCAGLMNIFPMSLPERIPGLSFPPFRI